ncbi:MAG: phytanoyl-CoA dioxygenase family protein, partial [Pseudomonadota bacterium]
MDRLRSRVLYLESYRNLRLLPALEPPQRALVEALRDIGSVLIEGFVPPQKLAVLRREFEEALHALAFETPCLAQTRVDRVRHADLIESQMYGSNGVLAARGVTFSREEARSYEQVVSDFRPSTLTAYMLERSAAYREVWLDPRMLAIVGHYMGMVPKLSEAYVRRNFPAPFLTMNHYWHRDLNTPFHLLKGFLFLTDCDLTTGPHEFILRSHRDFETLNGKRYFSDEEVDRQVPPGHAR